jgi:hypothetical protein
MIYFIFYPGLVGSHTVTTRTVGTRYKVGSGINFRSLLWRASAFPKLTIEHPRTTNISLRSHGDFFGMYEWSDAEKTPDLIAFK